MKHPTQYYIEKIETQAKLLGGFLTDAQTKQLLKHLVLVLEKNKVLNLTRITDFDEAIQLHVVDSLVALPYVQKAPMGKFADLGSGAGFPGIPVAIAANRKGTLVESVKKKAVALAGFVAELDLADSLEVSPMRAEELALQCPNEYSVVLARALSSLGSLLELASPLLQQGGQLIALKSIPSKDELDSAKLTAATVGMDFVLSNEHILPTVNREKRTIFVFTKNSDPTIKLPRRSGMAQRHPLN